MLKTNLYKPLPHMRNTLPLIYVMLLFSFISCKKEKASSSDSITNQQAAFMISTALASNANGLISIKNDIYNYTKNLATNSAGCGVPDISAAARQEAANAVIDYNYAMGYQYILNCTGTTKDSLSTNINYNGSFEATGLSGMNSGVYTIMLTGLADATNYYLNGTYQNSGTYTTTDGTNLNGNYSTTITITNYTLLKSNGNTTGGTAIVTVSGDVKNKSAFSYSGTLTFKSGGIALLVLGTQKYNVNLTTAEVTPTS